MEAQNQALRRELWAVLLYRYKRHVQSFLGRLNPFQTSPYAKLQKKRSSLEAGLLFTDGCHGDTWMNEKRNSTHSRHSRHSRHSVCSAAITYPSSAAVRPASPDSPPALLSTAGNRRPGTPLDPLRSVQVPRPTVPRPSSQDSFGSISIASSGLFSPFFAPAPHRSSQESLGSSSIASSGVFSHTMLSGPMSPSTVPSPGTSPPGTAKSPLSELATKYKPLTPTRAAVFMLPSNAPEMKESCGVEAKRSEGREG
ncbi:hypothetical protein NEMBOFW57_002007 [Staphylotrichum longicolle]|uniref:Uncharacterized protein n=1 Tax=Staphylotrichum longicolle TaxID=669026 RepID=A0AAD4I4A3_9PEZI|nr:hypothetical protein NEMBOFW57_002007 [Staphylotrichum longicolle]